MMIPSYLESLPLVSALRSRRSRRFARGLTMPPRGALSYQSRLDPQPLTEEEEALLAFAATTAYCEYLWQRYGRFPVNMAPFRTVLRYQVGHLDEEFYERFYRDGVLTPAHAGHQAAWHGRLPIPSSEPTRS